MHYNSTNFTTLPSYIASLQAIHRNSSWRLNLYVHRQNPPPPRVLKHEK